MLQYHRIYRLFPKPRFYLIAAVIVAALLGYVSLLKEETNGFSAVVVMTVLISNQ